jgi:hypothetical protein
VALSVAMPPQPRIGCGAAHLAPVAAFIQMHCLWPVSGVGGPWGSLQGSLPRAGQTLGAPRPAVQGVHACVRPGLVKKSLRHALMLGCCVLCALPTQRAAEMRACMEQATRWRWKCNQGGGIAPTCPTHERKRAGGWGTRKEWSAGLEETDRWLMTGGRGWVAGGMGAYCWGAFAGQQPSGRMPLSEKVCDV